MGYSYRLVFIGVCIIILCIHDIVLLETQDTKMKLCWELMAFGKGRQY